MMTLRKDANLQKRQANKSLKSQVLKLARSVSANTKLRDAEERLKAAASTTRYENEVNCLVSAISSPCVSSCVLAICLRLGTLR